jgi:hypothetical protein
VVVVVAVYPGDGTMIQQQERAITDVAAYVRA